MQSGTPPNWKLDSVSNLEQTREHVAVLTGFLLHKTAPLEVAARAGALLRWDNVRYPDLVKCEELIAQQFFPGEPESAVIGCLRGGYHRVVCFQVPDGTPDGFCADMTERDFRQVVRKQGGKAFKPPAYADNELDEFAEDFLGFVGVDLSRVSRLLREQIRYGFTHRALHWALTDVLQWLEAGDPNRVRGRSYTSLFDKKPLWGLMHAHFVQPTNLKFNLNEETKDAGWREEFSNVMFQTARTAPVKIPAMEAHQRTVRAFERRHERDAMTGDWLIYGESSAIPAVWSQQPSRVTLIPKVRSPMAASLRRVRPQRALRGRTTQSCVCPPRAWRARVTLCCAALCFEA